MCVLFAYLPVEFNPDHRDCQSLDALSHSHSIYISLTCGWLVNRDGGDVNDREDFDAVEAGHRRCVERLIEDDTELGLNVTSFVVKGSLRFRTGLETVLEVADGTIRYSERGDGGGLDGANGFFAVVQHEGATVQTMDFNRAVIRSSDGIHENGPDKVNVGAVSVPRDDNPVGSEVLVGGVARGGDRVREGHRLASTDVAIGGGATMVSLVFGCVVVAAEGYAL